jgi:5-methyltetrahydrofolate--homocysteine methyltransferase
VEVDGTIHDERGEYDAERDSVLAGLGLRVVRFSNERVLTDLPVVLGIVCRICRSRVGETSDQKAVPPSPLGKGDRGLGNHLRRGGTVSRYP